MPTITCLRCRGLGTLPTAVTNEPRIVPVCPDCRGAGHRAARRQGVPRPKDDRQREATLEATEFMRTVADEFEKTVRILREAQLFKGYAVGPIHTAWARKHTDESADVVVMRAKEIADELEAAFGIKQ